jgi:hypothetical protein
VWRKETSRVFLIFVMTIVAGVPIGLAVEAIRSLNGPERLLIDEGIVAGGLLGYFTTLYFVPLLWLRPLLRSFTYVFGAAGATACLAAFVTGGGLALAMSWIVALIAACWVRRTTPPTWQLRRISYCPRCGYDLRASPTRICSECGCDVLAENRRRLR